MSDAKSGAIIANAWAPELGFPLSTSSDKSSGIDLDNIPSKPLVYFDCHRDLEQASWPWLDSKQASLSIYTSIVIDLSDGGDDEPSSEPPGLGLVSSEPHLSTSTVIDLDDSDGIAVRAPWTRLSSVFFD